MKKTDLISKWLDFNLNDDELEAFNNLDASGSYQRISEAAKRFGSPHFDTQESYSRLQLKLEQPSRRSNWMRYVSGIAATLVIGLGLFYFLNSSPIEQVAYNNTTKEFNLPDSSNVTLNAGSSLAYDSNKLQWDRNVKLEGEAYFKVAKGKRFTVHTKHGTVAVLGTQFNVNSRNDFFEVVCYEGKVAVEYHREVIELTPGESYSMFGTNTALEKIEDIAPSWLNKKSKFVSTPYKHVVEELERQYDIKITGYDTEAETRFTGSFSHENLETALQAITIPLNLSYIINGKNVVLKNDQQ